MINAFVILIVSGLGFLGYEFYETRQEKKRTIEWEKERDTERDLENIEHIVYEHGTIEIHHYTNPTKAEFIRYVKELNCADAAFADFKQHVYNLIACMESQNHTNTDDVRQAAYILLHADMFDTWTSHYAYMWLNIAKTYWIMHPVEEMIPLQIDYEIDEIDDRVLRSKSF